MQEASENWKPAGWHLHLGPSRSLVVPGPDLAAPECGLSALENENIAMARATALISKVVHFWLDGYHEPSSFAQTAPGSAPDL